MNTLTFKPNHLTDDFKLGDFKLESRDIQDLAKFAGMPTALYNTDKKFGTHTYRDVLSVAFEEVQVLEDEGKYQILDPNSDFIPDDQFEVLVDQLQEFSGRECEVRKNGFELIASIKFDTNENDMFDNDVYRRMLTLTRKRQGGLAISTELLRVICTNMSMVADNQFKLDLKRNLPDQAMFLAFINGAANFSVEEFLNNLFKYKGEDLICTYSDMVEMHSVLTDLVDEPTANTLYPMALVENFYNQQGINVQKLPRKSLDKLPTGLTYYQAYNILTNGAKLMREENLSNKIKIAGFTNRSKLRNKQAVELKYNSIPEFTNSQIALWMGDGTERVLTA